MRRCAHLFVITLSMAALGACASAESVPEGAVASTPGAPVSAALLVPFEAEDGRFGFRDDSSGAVVVPARFELAQDFDAQSGLAAVVDGGAWWLIDADGRRVHRPFVYDNGPDYLVEGHSRIIDEGGKVGFIDARGAVVIAPRFDWASPFDDGVSQFCLGCHPDRDGEHQVMVGGVRGTVSPDGTVTFKD